MFETYAVGFDTYPAARDAVAATIAAGYRETAVNAIVQDKTLKGASDVDWETVRAEKSRSGEQRTVHGLDALVAGKDVVTTEDAGDLIAAGEIARIIVNTAGSEARGTEGLERALSESGVPADFAARHTGRLVHGGVILILRVEDDRERRALTVLDAHNARDRVRVQG